VVDGAPPVDALLRDASVVDCAADHRESADRTNDPLTLNDGAVEKTNLSLAHGGDPFTICGQIDPAQANTQVTDGDYYEFTVGGSRAVNVRIEMSAPDGAPTDPVWLELYDASGGPAEPIELATGLFRNDYAIVAGALLDPGTYWVSAVGFFPLPDDPVVYGIRVEENPFSCVTATGTADYTEQGDDVDSRGNDMVAIHYPMAPAATADAGDSPETTGITTQAGTVYHLHGTSALVVSAGDSYLDRDTFQFHTGPASTELEARLTWERDADPDVDMDLYLFAASDPSKNYGPGPGGGSLGATVSDTADEAFTVNVDPGTTYWLWVGAFNDTPTGDHDLPRDYDLTLCPRDHDASLAAQ
jgi:hypothetical protein